jgi:hypothetical protein
MLRVVSGSEEKNSTYPFLFMDVVKGDSSITSAHTKVRLRPDGVDLPPLMSVFLIAFIRYFI